MVDIWCCEEYRDTTSPPVAMSFSGSNGLEANSYTQLLELLGIAPAAPPELAEAAPMEAAACLSGQDTALAVQNPQLPAPGDNALAANETPIPGPAESRLEITGNQGSRSPQPIPKVEAIMPKQSEYDFMEEDDEQEEQDDSRPQPITAKDIARIDQMSPDELNGLIEDIDAHEEWEELRQDAKQRIAYWRGGLKKADQSPRCVHLKTNGNRCGSPAMKEDSLCYFHSQAHAQRESSAAGPLLEMPSLEDRLGVQLAIMRVCNMVVDKSLDEKTGRAVLAGLRPALRNLGNADAIYEGVNNPR